MLYLEKRKGSGIWRIRGTYQGVAIDQSARTREKAEAERIRQALEKQIFADVFGFTKKETRYTFGDAVATWLEGGGELDPFPYFEVVLDELESEHLDEVTQGTIDRAVLRAMPTQSPATRKRHFYTPVSVILRFAARERMMTPLLLERPKVEQKRPEILQPSQVEELLKEAGDFAPLITFFIGTGGRTSEVLRSEVRDLSPYRNRVTFWKTKGGRISRSDVSKARSVDLCQRTRKALPDVQEGRLWPNYSEDQYGRFTGPATRLVRLCDRLGWPRFRPHVFRHTWASWQYALDPDPLRLMVKGGWSDQKMIQVYVHLGTPDLAKEVRKFGWFEPVELGN